MADFLSAIIFNVIYCIVYRQFVAVDWTFSNKKPVLAGVSGSVLRPILFFMYIDDLEDDITSKLADERNLLRQGDWVKICEAANVWVCNFNS